MEDDDNEDDDDDDDDGGGGRGGGEDDDVDDDDDGGITVTCMNKIRPSLPLPKENGYNPCPKSVGGWKTPTSTTEYRETATYTQQYP